jgi:hypothetical protein
VGSAGEAAERVAEVGDDVADAVWGAMKSRPTTAKLRARRRRLRTTSFSAASPVIRCGL